MLPLLSFTIQLHDTRWKSFARRKEKFTSYLEGQRCSNEIRARVLIIFGVHLEPMSVSVAIL